MTHLQSLKKKLKRTMRKLRYDLHNFKEEYEVQFLAASMTLSDTRRLQFKRLNNEYKAEEEANKAYN